MAVHSKNKRDLDIKGQVYQTAKTKVPTRNFKEVTVKVDMAAIVDVLMVPEEGRVGQLSITDLGDLLNSDNVLGDADLADTDSGHWSADYSFPCSALTNEELVSEFATESGVSQCSPRTSSLSSISDAEVSERVQTLEPTVSLVEAEPVTENGATPAETEGKICIVCFEQEVIEQLYHDDDYWDYYNEFSAYESISSHLTLPCCDRPLCKECMRAIIKVNVDEGRVQIRCPHPECGKPLAKNELTAHMSAEVKAKYDRFLVDIEGDSKRKTCPNCCEITELELAKGKEAKIVCKSCEFEWCFRCHAPWHTGITCKHFRKGDKHFRKWTKGKNAKGINNCQKCPTCRVWIERSTGCNHMTCGRCHTHFCYYCGKRFLELGIIDHDSELNVWGCDQNLLPNRPHLRRFVRSSYLGVKVSFLAGYPTLLVGAAVLLVVGGAVALPIYGGYKLYRLNQYRRKNNRRRHH